MAQLQIAVFLKQDARHCDEPDVQQLKQPDQSDRGIKNSQRGEKNCEQSSHERFELTLTTPEKHSQHGCNHRQQAAKPIEQLWRPRRLDSALRIKAHHQSGKHIGKQSEVWRLITERREDIDGHTARRHCTGDQGRQSKAGPGERGTTAHDRHFTKIIGSDAFENGFTDEQCHRESCHHEQRVTDMVERDGQKRKRIFKFVQHTVQHTGRGLWAASLILGATMIAAHSAYAGVCNGQQVMIAIQRPDGSRFAVGAEKDRLEAFLTQRRAQLANESARMDRMSSNVLRVETATAFDRAQAQVPAFASWVYGWASNYVFSYELLFASAQSGMRSVRDGTPVVAGIETTVRQSVETAFQRRVLEPIQFDQALDDASREAFERGLSEWRRFLVAEAAAWDQFGRDHCIMAVVPSGSGVPLIDLKVRTADSSELATPDHPTMEPSQQFAVRALRPLGVRALMLGLRLAEIGSLAALPAAFGFAGAPGFFAGAVLTTGAVWLVDYSINATDAALHRAEFEQELVARLAAVKEKTDETLVQSVVAGLSRMTTPYRDSLTLRGMR